MRNPARAYLITYFEDGIDEERFREICVGLEHFRGAVGQVECCPETKKEHLQVYVEFSKPTRVSAIQRVIPGAHCEYRKGTSEEAKAYCSKEDTRLRGPWSSGQLSVSQGCRSDLEGIRDEIKEGHSELQIAEDHFAIWVRHHKAFQRYAQLRIESRSWITELYILWGAPGTGKTRHVYDLYGKDCVYDWPRTGDRHGAIWVDGYDGRRHSVVLIDDFYGWLPLHLLLRIADRYPMQLPVKGGFVQFVPKTIYITSNKPWTDWYAWDSLGPDLEGAFKRRITKVVHFN